MRREPKGQEKGPRHRILKLSGKRSVVGETSGETSMRGHRRGTRK